MRRAVFPSFDGRPRLVTTNFDTLFERAWVKATGRRLPSSAGPGMPPVRSHEFSGILHIHGRLEDKGLGLERTDLVLTAPNFGEAYMRNGWASRTIYDLLRRYTIGLIGYSADEPPIRYMLEATEEGRLNFPDLKPAYAFVPDELDDEGSTRELWRAKGLYPIIYEPGATHEPLYDALREWAASVRDPGGWAAPRIASITAPQFAEGSAEHRIELAFLAHDVSTIQAVARAASDPAWIDTGIAVHNRQGTSREIRIEEKLGLLIFYIDKIVEVRLPLIFLKFRPSFFPDCCKFITRGAVSQRPFRPTWQ